LDTSNSSGLRKTESWLSAIVRTLLFSGHNRIGINGLKIGIIVKFPVISSTKKESADNGSGNPERAGEL